MNKIKELNCAIARNLKKDGIMLGGERDEL